jgi:hypothetical protein
MWLNKITSPLTPLQPGDIGKTWFFLAGEGMVKERGLHPLSKPLPIATGRLRGASVPLSTYPPLQTTISKAFSYLMFGEGDTGGEVGTVKQPKQNKTGHTGRPN